MHIGIDAHALGQRQAGNETYIGNLIKSLAEVGANNRYTLYLSNAEAAARWRTGFTKQFPNFEVRLLPPPTPLVRVPVALEFELRLRPVDALHAPGLRDVRDAHGRGRSCRAA